MIYYCVKTDEFLSVILDKVSFGAQYYCQIEVPLNKAESVIEKLKNRYLLDQTARQRNYRLNQKLIPVVDLAVLLNRSLFAAGKVRLCLICTVPPELRPIELNIWPILKKEYQLDRSEKENFYNISDRKNRLKYMSVSNPDLIKVKQEKLKSIAVYELVQITYTIQQRKQKALSSAKQLGWTWRLHKDFIELKKKNLVDVFKKNQNNSKNHAKQDEAVQKELQKIYHLCGFRGVRQDIFSINQNISKLYFSYFNRKSSVKLGTASYLAKKKRLVSSFKEAIHFHSEN